MNESQNLNLKYNIIKFKLKKKLNDIPDAMYTQRRVNNVQMDYMQKRRDPRHNIENKENASTSGNLIHALKSTPLNSKTCYSDSQKSKNKEIQTQLIKELIEVNRKLREKIQQDTITKMSALSDNKENNTKRGRKSKAEKEREKLDELIKQMNEANNPNSELAKMIKARRQEQTEEKEETPTQGEKKIDKTKKRTNDQCNGGNKQPNKKTKLNMQIEEDDETKGSGDAEEDGMRGEGDDGGGYYHDSEYEGDSFDSEEYEDANETEKTMISKEDYSYNRRRNENAYQNESQSNIAKNDQHERPKIYKIKIKSNETFEEVYNSSRQCEREIKKAKPTLIGEISTRINAKRKILSIWTSKEEDLHELEERWPDNAFKYGVKVLDDENDQTIYSICMWARKLSIEDEEELKQEYSINSIIKKRNHFKLELSNKIIYERLINEGKIRLGTFRANIAKYQPTRRVEQCEICFKTNHSARWCRNKHREYCKRCGQEGHKYEKCTKRPKCINCEGHHYADDRWNCPKLKTTNQTSDYNTKRVRGTDGPSIKGGKESEELSTQLLQSLLESAKLLGETIEENQIVNIIVQRTCLKEKATPETIDTLCKEILQPKAKDKYEAKLKTLERLNI